MSNLPKITSPEHAARKRAYALKRGAALKKIRHQFEAGGEHRLCYAIIEQAVKDLEIKHTRESARSYLLGKEIAHAEICGVGSEWIRRVLTKCGISLSPA